MFKYLKPLKNLDIEIYHYTPNLEIENIKNINAIISNSNQTDLKRVLKITLKQANAIKEYFENNGIKNINELKNIKGIGTKTIDKIERLINTNNSNNKIERQLTLDFKNGRRTT